MNLIMMIPDIPLDQIRSHPIPYRPHKIPILPKLPSPQLPLHLRKLTKNLTRRYTLQQPNNMSNRTPRRKCQKDMNMILRYSHLLNLKPMVRSHFRKNLTNFLPNIFSLNPFPVFRCPYPIVLRIVNRMGTLSNRQQVVLHYIFSAFGRHTFHSRPQDGVFRCDLNKTEFSKNSPTLD